MGVERCEAFFLFDGIPTYLFSIKLWKKNAFTYQVPHSVVTAVVPFFLYVTSTYTFFFSSFVLAFSLLYFFITEFLSEQDNLRYVIVQCSIV